MVDTSPVGTSFALKLPGSLTVSVNVAVRPCSNARRASMVPASGWKTSMPVTLSHASPSGGVNIPSSSASG